MNIDTFDSFLPDVYVSGLKAPIGSRRVGRLGYGGLAASVSQHSGLFYGAPGLEERGMSSCQAGS